MGMSPQPESSSIKAFASSGFSRVLVCLDRSGAAEAALPLAAHLARLDRSRITLLHVLEAAPDTRELHATDALEWEIARQEAHAYLDRLATRLWAQGVAADTQIAEGMAAQSIATTDADLVVLSACGDTPLSRSPVGTTAQKVLALARGAVLILPPDIRAPALHVPPRRVLVPLDGSARGESVLPTVVRIARADDAEVVIAHAVAEPVRTEVLSTPEDIELAGELARRLSARAQAYLERIRSGLAAAGVKAHASLLRAVDHREGLAALAASERIDLIVLSAHGAACNPKSPFGSVTSYLIAHSQTPVLVLQDVPRDALTLTGPHARLPPRSVDARSGTV